MGVRIEPHAEPLPGYRLIERLGGGGFGEVWKAEAPGGLFKAIKFVYGDLEALDSPDGARAEQELKALSRVKSVHHPYILSLERFDILEGQLLIVMELADRTLWDRFKECRGQGLPGIPREELLGYMRETAEALDLMNSLYQLQHLDIKPQNLFLIYNHVKVADFGLVKDLGGRSVATVTGGSTPVYAAPETFDGWLSRFTDQYSLAIVYQELLTGQRPFTGNSIRQLVMQHLQGTPELGPLPLADRPAIARALSKKPDDRFPTCQEMVTALSAATLAPAKRVVTDSPLEDTTTDSECAAGETPADKPGPGDGDPMLTHRAREKAPTPAAAPSSVPIDPPQVLPPRPPKIAPADAFPAPQAPPPTGVTCMLPLHKQRPVTAAPSEPLSGILQPALMIGLGRLGLQTLRELRRNLSQEFGPPEALPQLRLLGVDIDSEAIAAASQGDGKAALRQSEVILAKLQRASHYLKPREGKLPHETWLNPKLLYRLGKQEGAGARALGRLAVVDHARALSRRLDIELQACCAQDTPHEGTQRADLGLRSAHPRVYIIAGLGGQTGSGMILDVAYMARSVLRRHGHEQAEIVGLFYLPPAGRNPSGSNLVTAVAALKELQLFTAKDAVFTADLDLHDPAVTGRKFMERGPALQRCLFLPLPEKGNLSEEGATPDSVGLVGQYLYRDLATPVGKMLDEARAALAAPPDGSIRLGSLGLFRFVWPRRELLERTSRRACRRIVERWMAKSAKGLTDEVAAWSEQQWEAEGMRPENLIARHQELCEQYLQQNPERLISSTLHPLVSSLRRSQPAHEPFLVGPVIQGMATLIKLLGHPEECRSLAGSSSFQEPGTIETALADAAASIAEHCDHQLAVWIVQLIEDPRYRLAGAEEALRQFTGLVERALQSQEILTRELQERAAALYERIHVLIEGPATSQTPGTSGGRKSLAKKGNATPAADMVELIKSYAKCRYQSLILVHINRLFVSLRGHLSDQVREVGFCRQRLGELAELLDKRVVAMPADRRAKPASLRAGCSELAATAKPRERSARLTALPRAELLLPEGCRDLEAAVTFLEEKITPKDILDLDERMQHLVKQNFQALVQVCMGSANVVRNLAPMMVRESEAFLEPRLAGASVGEMFLRQKAQADSELVSASQALAAAYDDAGSGMVKDPAAEIAVAAMPADAHGQRLQNFLRSAVQQVRTIAVPRPDEIVFVREEYFAGWSDLEQLSASAQLLYQQRLAADPGTLHTREDIPAWKSPEKAYA